VVDVWTGSDFGSGFRLTSRLVLTAGHVVRPGEEVIVRTVACGDRLRSKVVWRGRDTDTALLQILGDLPNDLQDVEPAGLGWAVGTSRPLACSAIGFPWCQEQSDGIRDTEHLRGEIQLGTAILGGRYQVSVQSGVPRRARDSFAWAGMSGAALVAGDFVVGVITEDAPNFLGGRLTAVPVGNMVKDDGFAAVWRAKTGDDPQLAPVELAPLTAQETTGRTPGSPASLLRADSEAVRFRGRTQETTRLLAWAGGSGAGTLDHPGFLGG